jgi:hypothetical protein
MMSTEDDGDREGLVLPVQDAQENEGEGTRGESGIELAVSDPAQLRSLREWIRGQADVDATVTAGTPGPGELGVLDVLSVVASSSGVVAAVRTLPEFIRARRAGFRIEATIRGEQFILDATNVDDVLPAILEYLRDAGARPVA